MYTIVVSLMMVICILLVIVVLIQNSKGGGLATGAAGSQVLGVKRTTDFLEKATWTLGIALVSLALDFLSSTFLSLDFLSLFLSLSLLSLASESAETSLELGAFTSSGPLAAIKIPAPSLLKFLAEMVIG